MSNENRMVKAKGMPNFRSDDRMRPRNHGKFTRVRRNASENLIKRIFQTPVGKGYFRYHRIVLEMSAMF
jgi:hypothetical protein